jgi:hypothetical protein
LSMSAALGWVGRLGLAWLSDRQRG